MNPKMCYNCFKAKDESLAICPHCGYNSTQGSKYPHALRPGTVLGGKYILGRVLGQGGFGITYLAQDYQSKEIVAVKEYFPESMATRSHTTVSTFSGQYDESFEYGKKCFLEEAKTLAEFIGNPNIVRVYSFFEENGTAYFVMEYVQGTSLKAHLDLHNGKISYNEAKWILLPVMDALSAVHAKGIIHRDISPDNIFITNNSGVKLIDFGAARYSMGDKSKSLDVILKHGYAPKEQYTRRGRQGAYTDVYALAATFYRSITGRVPPDSIDRMDEDDLVEPNVCGVNISNEAEEALLKALSVQPIDRFQSMGEFKKALIKGDIAAEDRKKAIEEQRKLHEQKAIEEQRKLNEQRAREAQVLKENQKAEEARQQAAPIEQKAEVNVNKTTAVPQENKIPQAKIEKQDDISKLVEAAAQKSENKKKKRMKIAIIISSAILLSVIVFSIVFIVKFFDPERSRTYGDFTYYLTYDRENVVIENYLGDENIVIVPETIKGKYVWKIDEYAFSGNEEITQVEIEGCKYIGTGAFGACVNLTKVTITDGTEDVGEGAFSYCDWLVEVHLPNSLTEISPSAFEDSDSLRDIYFDGTEDDWNSIDGTDELRNYLPDDVSYHFLDSENLSEDSYSETNDLYSDLVEIKMDYYSDKYRTERVSSISEDDARVHIGFEIKAKSIDSFEDMPELYIKYLDTDGYESSLSLKKAVDSEGTEKQFSISTAEDWASEDGKFTCWIEDDEGNIVLEKSIEVIGTKESLGNEETDELSSVQNNSCTIDGVDLTVGVYGPDDQTKELTKVTKSDFNIMIVAISATADSVEELKDFSCDYVITDTDGKTKEGEISFENTTDKENSCTLQITDLGSKLGELTFELKDSSGKVLFSKSIEVVDYQDPGLI